MDTENSADNNTENSTSSASEAKDKKKSLLSLEEVCAEIDMSNALEEEGGRGRQEPIFIDRDPTRFRYILDFYRDGKMHLPVTVSLQEMQKDIEFFCLPTSAFSDGVQHDPDEFLALRAELQQHFHEKLASLDDETDKQIGEALAFAMVPNILRLSNSKNIQTTRKLQAITIDGIGMRTEFDLRTELGHHWVQSLWPRIMENAVQQKSFVQKANELLRPFGRIVRPSKNDETGKLVVEDISLERHNLLVKASALAVARKVALLHQRQSFGAAVPTTTTPTTTTDTTSNIFKFPVKRSFILQGSEKWISMVDSKLFLNSMFQQNLEERLNKFGLAVSGDFTEEGFFVQQLQAGRSRDPCTDGPSSKRRKLDTASNGDGATL